MHLSFSKELKKSIQIFETGDPKENPWINGQPELVQIEVVAYDSDWLNIFNDQKAKIQQDLGQIALEIEHVGSTAVKGLASKPIVDIDLIVENPNDEHSYVDALNKIGFELIIREPSWYQHRMLKLRNPEINLHVFPPNCPEHFRHILFREWLKNHADDLAIYAEVKNIAKQNTHTFHDYNLKKQDVIHEIYQKIFASLDQA